MSPVLTQPRPAASDAKAGPWALVTGVLVVAFVLLAVMEATKSPAHVKSITVDNPHQWAASVEAAGTEPDGWVGLGTVGRQTSNTFQDVLDQGARWKFRFSYGAVDGGEFTISRSELERGGWKVAIPETFADRMRAAGLAPSGG